MSTLPRRCIAVGLGGIARVVVPALARRPWATIAGIVDVRQDALELGQRLLGVPEGALFTDLDAALAALDADTALIHTPSEWHYEQCRSSLAAGLDVLVAKPISNRFADAVRLGSMPRPPAAPSPWGSRCATIATTARCRDSSPPGSSVRRRA